MCVTDHRDQITTLWYGMTTDSPAAVPVQQLWIHDIRIQPHCRGGVMVWADISLECRTDLPIFDCNLNARRYEEEIMLEYVVPRHNTIAP